MLQKRQTIQEAFLPADVTQEEPVNAIEPSILNEPVNSMFLFCTQFCFNFKSTVMYFIMLSINFVYIFIGYQTETTAVEKYLQSIIAKQKL